MIAGVALGLLWPQMSSAWQGSKGKKGPETEKIFGTVKSVEKKGKTATVTVEQDDGETLEVLLNSKVKLAINGKGDSEFLKPKVWLSSQKVVAVNNLLFCSRYTVHVGNNPAPLFRAETDQIYHVSGQIAAVDKESVTLSFGNPSKTQKINFEEGAALDISVTLTDLDAIAEGSEIELEGIKRGTKFSPQLATVKLAQPLVAAEVFGTDKGKADKGKAAAKSGKKSAKPKDDDADKPDDPDKVDKPDDSEKKESPGTAS